MPGNNHSRDVTNLQVQLISTIMKLAKKDIPVAAVWYHEKEAKIYGTKFLKGLITNLEKVDLENAIKLDILNLVSPEPDEPLLELDENVPDKMRAKTVFQSICQKHVPDCLPFPLSCMNRKEKISWITKEILREQKVKSGETFSTVKYGDENLIPSFWPQEDWDWKNLTKHLSNVSNSSYTGPGNLQDFITKLILNCISALGEDPETFVEKNIDKKKLARRMKSHRIHEESHIIEEEAIDANIEVEEMDAQEGAYRAPCDPPPPQSTTFIPRRKMPSGYPRSSININENIVYPDLNSSECGPLPPTATPVNDDQTPACDQSFTYMDNDVPYLSQIVPHS